MSLTKVVFGELNAKDLKKSLKNSGVKVLMCKQGSNSSVCNVAIEGSLYNFEQFAKFAEVNNLVNATRKPHVNYYKSDEKYIDLHGVYKIESISVIK